MKRILAFLICVLLFHAMCISCTEEEIMDNNELIINPMALDTIHNDTTYKDSIGNDGNNGKTINNEDKNKSSKYIVRKVGTNIVNYVTYNESNKSAQGMAVYGNTMYRLYNTGICQLFDISDRYNPKPLNIFALGSFGSRNHSNCAQFAPTSNFDVPLLYVSGLYGKCYVEELSNNSSKLIQIITFNEKLIFNESTHYNLICGDDSFLWLMGGSNTTLYFAKLIRPDVNIGDVNLSVKDVIDFWSISGYSYSASVWQGGKVYNGKLYFVFGTTSSRRHIAIYDTKTHELIEDIDLNDYIKEEPEDCEIIDNNIIITTNGGYGYYIIYPEE